MDVDEDSEPSAKKKKGMGAGTPLPTSSATGREPPRRRDCWGNLLPSEPPRHGFAFQGRGNRACPGQLDGWRGMADPSRPAKPEVMPAGAIEKFCKPAGSN
eukprot:5674561-Amphidinium_carterae.1